MGKNYGPFKVDVFIETLAGVSGAVGGMCIAGLEDAALPSVEVTSQLPTAVPTIHVHSGEHHHNANFGIDMGIGAVAVAGLTLATRFGAHKYRVSRFIHNFRRGIEKDHDAGMFLPFKPFKSQDE